MFSDSVWERVVVISTSVVPDSRRRLETITEPGYRIRIDRLMRVGYTESGRFDVTDSQRLLFEVADSEVQLTDSIGSPKGECLAAVGRVRATDTVG